MNRAFAILLLAAASFCLHAEDLYLRKGASGSNNGSDWNNAYTDFDQIVWGSGAAKLSAGDTLWIAGGTYTTQLAPTVSGTSGNVISIKRVRSTNSTPVAATGWSSGYDSTVIQAVSTEAILLNAGMNYITFDGQIWGGWSITNKNNGGGLEFGGTATNITLRYLEIHGPANPASVTRTSDTRGMDITPSGHFANLTVEYCNVYDEDSTVYISGTSTSDNVLFQYNWFHNADSANAASFHQNLIFCGALTNPIFRYNKFYDTKTEGLFFNFNPITGAKIYGNLFYLGSVSDDTPRGIENDDNCDVDLYIYNNTFVGLSHASIRFSNLGSATPTGAVTNNLFINCGGQTYTAGVAHDYNASSSGSIDSESHGVSGITSPFVDAGSFDYHIISTIASTKPRDKGFALVSEFNTDPDGITRGSDGTWDIGAYEYNSGGGGGGGTTTVAAPAGLRGKYRR